IIDHVLQLTELDIFGTVSHCFFLLFLIPLLYQKTRDFPSKTAVFRHLKMQGKQGLFYASFLVKIMWFLWLWAVRYQCLTSTNRTHAM
ncbi:hypothetical protein LI187_15620, partial [bacterium 210820-DFI.6.38]|nr:hypothetical protein [bacterium 210820-DFI.6.38]